jgi:hypothetical protein
MPAAAEVEVVRKSWVPHGTCQFDSGHEHHISSQNEMKEKVISIKQINEAKRLHRALEMTRDGSKIISLSQMVDKVVEMDRQSELEYKQFQADQPSKALSK